MNAQTPRAALLAVAEKPGSYFELASPDGKAVHLRFEEGTYYLKMAGPGMEWAADLDLAVDLLRFLGGPITISRLTRGAYDGGETWQPKAS